MKRRDVMSSGALACLAPGFATGATPGVDAPPEPGPQRAIVVPTASAQRLANGLQLLTVARAGVPLVTASLYVRAGRESDPAALAGLAAITAGLLSKGARRGGKARSASALAQDAEALGSALDASANWRVASLSMTITTPKLDAALALLADLARAPEFEPAELERLRTQSLDGLRITLASPGDVAALAARRAFWGDSAYGGSATPGSLPRISRDHVRRFHAERYQPDQAVVVLAGAITPPQALGMVTRHFGGWMGQAAPLPEPGAARAIGSSVVLIDMPGSGQSGVLVAAPFAAIAATDRRVAEVAAALVGGDYSARLNQEIRIKRGLSYGAYGGGESQRVGGWFSAQAQTDHPNAVVVAQIMRDELLRAGRELAPREELAARQATLIGSFARQLTTTSGLAGQVASQWFQGRPLDALGAYVADVLAVTPEQVRDYAARAWTAGSLRTVISADVAAAGASMAGLAEDTLRLRLNELDLDSAALVTRR